MRLCKGRTRSRSAPGSKPGQHLNNRDFGAEGGVDGAEFQADVSTADYQQSAGYFAQVQRGCGIHHARGVEFEAGNDRGPRAGGDDDAVEGKRIFGAVCCG